jgi:AcrR family transcriptional regulator
MCFQGENLTRPDIEDRMLDAVELLLARYGYSKMTMEDIARESGLGRRTLYLHFSSKEEIALCSIDRIVERLVIRLDEIAASDQPVNMRIREMLITRVMFRFDSVRDYHQNFNDLFATLRPAYLARRDGYFNLEAERIAGVIREGQRSGVFGVMDAPTQARLMLTATNALLPYSLSPRELGEREHVEAVVTGIADLLLNGLR